MKICLLAFLLPAFSWAADPRDFLSPLSGTMRVAPSGGDTIGTYSVTCDIAAATQIRAAVTNGSRRKLCVQNNGAYIVNLGTSTVVASNLYQLGESTSTAIFSSYCTNSSAALYCGTATSSTSSGTVRAIEETQSVP